MYFDREQLFLLTLCLSVGFVAFMCGAVLQMANYNDTPLYKNGAEMRVFEDEQSNQSGRQEDVSPDMSMEESVLSDNSTEIEKQSRVERERNVVSHIFIDNTKKQSNPVEAQEETSRTGYEAEREQPEFSMSVSEIEEISETETSVSEIEESSEAEGTISEIEESLEAKETISEISVSETGEISGAEEIISETGEISGAEETISETGEISGAGETVSEIDEISGAEENISEIDEISETETSVSEIENFLEGYVENSVESVENAETVINSEACV